MATSMDEGVDFSEILHKSRALRDRQEATTRAFADSIPRLERALPQIDRESRRLITAGTASPHPPEADALALRFLSERGIPTGSLAHTLQNAALLDTPFDAAPPHFIPDVPTYLEGVQEETIIDAMESALLDTKENSLNAIADGVDNDWDMSKRDRITLPAMRAAPRRTPQPRTPSTAPGGVFASPFRFAHDADAFARTAPGTPHRPHLSRAVASVANHTDSGAPIYEGIVRRAVHSRASPSAAFAVATAFDDALIEHLAPRNDHRNASRSVQNLHATFNALRYITAEADSAGAPREGVYGGLYLPHDRRRACLGALRFLCLQFREDKMRHEVAMRPVQAARGGVPGILGDVRAYLNLAFHRGVPEELDNGPRVQGLPLWPQVYYCLRSGDRSAALQLVESCNGHGDGNPSVALMEDCLREFIGSGERRQVPDVLLTKLVQDYGLNARRGQDPYYRVCCVVIARLNPAAGDKMALPDPDYDQLFQSIEDYLWLRLSIARVDGDAALPGALGTYALPLRAVQEEIREFGPSHFDPRGDSPLFYALVLLLTGQYAAAVQYLDGVANSCAEAVHIAFVLYYYGMLRPVNPPQSGDSDRSSDTDALDNSCLKVDYADLVWRYISRFSTDNPTGAVIYLFTIRNAVTRDLYLKKLLLTTGKADMLAGATNLEDLDVRTHRQCVLEEMWPLAGREGAARGGWQAIVEAAAVDAEENANTNLAMMLFDVCGRYGRVARILIDRLATELTARGVVRDRLVASARGYRRKLDARGVGGASVARQRDDLLDRCLPSLDALLRLCDFYDRMWAREFDDAWRILQATALLPVSEDQLVGKTLELRPGGGGVWLDKLCERVPDVLMAAMECIAALYAAAQRGRDPVARAAASRELRAAARVLVNFSAMMPHNSADVSARLVRLEVLMT